ncbi:Pr6Pr family membrane protein [Qipengyuania zhejiangensis]|uniref:Pr6Pr family membrane protein n=1 Tax=Qipengyuania zhejiangensis TaxID=3077782 RepID=UPI002D77B674|nr:Pr6Pr family membrane protein [Qipengyuania sp. Z2]
MEPARPPFSLERALAGVIAVLVFVSLAVQTTINLEQDGSPLAAFGLLLRYFTIWSNLTAGLMLGWVALGGRAPGRAVFALATALSVVALVYHALLSPDHHPVGLDWWTNLAFHTLVPAATIAWWIAFYRADAFLWKSLTIVTPAPIAYTVFALIYGASSGFYPYFFLDQPALGWSQLAINIVGLALFFVAMGAALLGVRRLVSARA